MANKNLVSIGLLILMLGSQAMAQSALPAPPPAPPPNASAPPPAALLELPGTPQSSAVIAPPPSGVSGNPSGVNMAMPTPPHPMLPPGMMRPGASLSPLALRPTSAPNVSLAPPQLAAGITPLTTKNPDLLMAPLHLGNTSLMFSRSDVDTVSQLIEIYDNAGQPKKTTDNAASVKDDLKDLFGELSQQQQQHEVKTAPMLLPNLYLASIVYYTPTNWSIWVNGKKQVYDRNRPENELYVSRISRNEVELVWKPSTLLDTGTQWRQLTDNGKQPLPDITVDEAKGTITMIMHPNQTFIPQTLKVHEGLVKSSHMSRPATAENNTHSISAAKPQMHTTMGTETRMPAPPASPTSMPMLPPALMQQNPRGAR